MTGETRYLLLLITGIILSACRQSDSAPAFDKARVAEEVKTTLHNYYRDIKSNGILAEFKYLDSSDDFFWIPPGFSHPLTYDSVAFILKSNASGFRSIDNTFDSLRIIPLSNNLATYYCIMHSVMMDTSGKKFSQAFIESGTLIKRKEGWKLLSGQTSILNQ